jgi:quercetin dioxygenase-like cupin family protein
VERRHVMAHRGETIENPLTGERMTFLKTTADTSGRSFEFEFVAPPGWAVSEHIHPHQHERTQMVSGVLSGRVAGEEFRLVSGEVRVVPSSVVHAWRNPSDQEEARFSVEFSPALKMESGFETAWALARDGKATKAGLPKNPLQLVVFANEHKDEVFLTRPPIPVQKALFAVLGLLAPVGRLLGYRATYSRYGALEESTGSGSGSSSAAPRLRGIVVAVTVVAIFLVLFLLRRRNRLGRR